MLSKRRIQRLCVARQRQERAIRLLVYVALAAGCGALWSGIAALALRLSGTGVLAFGVSMALATFCAVAVVCSGNKEEKHGEEADVEGVSEYIGKFL